MTENEPADGIVQRILEQYSDRPRGWRVLSTPRGEMLVIGPESAYQLKIIPLNPFEFTGAGTEIPNPDGAIDALKSTPEFGLRSLSEEDVKGLFETLSDPRSSRLSVESIIKRVPMSPEELNRSRGGHFLSGPVLTRPDLGSLSPDILRTQVSLDRAADELFRKRYPLRAGMFV